MKLLLYGPPGAGKDTQGHILSQRYGAAFVSAGRLLRAEMHTNSEIGQSIIPYVQAGDHVPSGIVHRIVHRALSRPDALAGYVMNGYPRSQETLESYLRLDRPDAVLVLDVDEKTVRLRLEMRARFDDTPGTITKRLAIYHQHTPGILERFAEAGIPVFRIDGTPPAGHVTKAIAASLAPAVPKRRFHLPFR